MRTGIACLVLLIVALLMLLVNWQRMNSRETQSATLKDASTESEPRQGNLLYNGDFARVTTNSPPDGWRIWGASQYKDPSNYTLDQVSRHDGKASLRIRHPAGTGGYIVTDPNHAVQPRKGMMYVISFWARADKPGRLPFYLEAYQSIHPYVEAPDPGGGTIEVTTSWQQFTFEYHEGWDFLAEHGRYLILVFKAAKDSDDDRTLWINDVSVLERKSPREGRLIDETTLKYAPLEHRLRPGERFEFTVDANKILRPATRAAGGISFHRVAGWTGVPFDKQGQYVLPLELEHAVKDLRLPMTRFYALGDEPFGVNASIDGVAFLCRQCDIPQDRTVLELEIQSADKKLTADQWAAAVKHAISKKYDFHYWEIANEPYASVWGRETTYPKAEDYVRQVIDVSAAIRREDACARVGIAVCPGSLMWCGYALKQAAGSYDFVVGHFYCFVDTKQKAFEDIVLAENYKTLDQVLRLNALIQLYNPGREIFQCDTEWGMHGGGAEGEAADGNEQNANIVGTLHRAVRLIYYAREDILRGASSWEMFTRIETPGFGILSPEAPDKRFLIYWLYYYFNRHVGQSVLDIEGTAPYYIPVNGEDKSAKGAGPLTPAVATLSKDGKSIYLVAVNGSWKRAVPCRMRLTGFSAKGATGIVLSQDDMKAKALLHRKEDAVSELRVTVAGQDVQFTMPSHSVIFVTVEQRDDNHKDDAQETRQTISVKNSKTR